MEKVDILKSCKLFAGFSDEVVAGCADAFEEREFEAGGDLFAQGARGASFYVIGEGMVRVVVTAGDGTETVLGSLVQGEHLGGISLLRAGAHLVTARADSNTGILELTQQRFLQLQKERPQAAMKLLIAIVMDFTRLARENEGFFRDVIAARAAGEG